MMLGRSIDSAMRTPQPSMHHTPPTHRAPLREAHAHLLALGQSMRRLDFSSCVGVHDCLSRVSKAAAELRVIHNFGDRAPIGGVDSHGTSAPHHAHASSIASTSSRPWLIATGLRIHAWNDPRWPTMDELDGACSDIPCFLAGFDHHSAVCNSLAFAHFGYDAHSPDPVGGTIVRDARSQPTGLLLESAYTRARELIPQPTHAEAVSLVESACLALSALGYVEVHDLLAQPSLGRILAELDDAGRLPLSVGLFAPMDATDAFAGFGAFAHGSRAWTRSRVRFLGGKVFADGTLSSATAAMLEEYREPMPRHPRGQLLLTGEDLMRAMECVAGLGVSLAVHAIGDRAVRTVLDAYERVSRLSSRRPGLRIEHAEVIDEADVPRFGRLGVTASVQPCHLLYDVEVLRRQLPHRLERVLPLRELIDSGLVPGESLVFGSDVPIVPADPLDSIRAAVGRRGMAAGEAIAPAQAITEAEAWACFGAISPGSCS
jgi:predicted amidohydrolase YtcJ